jgi:hypothetical protein
MLTLIQQEPRMLELLNNKSVSLIAPAPYLIGKNRGEEFDNYDLIARPNEIIPLAHLRKDYGSRTDLFFCNFGTPWMPGIKRKISLNDNNEYFKDIKMVIGSAIKADHSEGNFLDWPNDYASDVPKNFQSINKPNLPFYWIGVEDYKKIYSVIGAEFNTGIAAIVMLLHYPITKLNLAGFTFYHGGNSYRDLYCEGHMDSQDTDGRSFGISAGHGQVAHMRQLAFFKTLYQNNKEIISIDEEMQRVLSL